MNKTFLTAVSAIAVMAAMPALADTDVKAGAKAEVAAEPGSDAAAAQSTGSVKQDVENAWEDIKSDTSKAYNKAKDETAEAYQDIKAALINDDAKIMDVTDVTINSSTTAAGMIGQPIFNGEERVGKVKDIIVDRDGKAMMVVVADGDFFGMGKLAAFDYSSVMKVNAAGDVMTPLTEKTIEQAAEFSYDREKYSDTVRVIPSNGYSVAKLLEGQLVDTKGETLGQMDDVQFRDGSAAHLIIGFDRVLGLGGEKAALSYDTASIVADGQDYDFQLSAEKSVQFESYKKTATN